MTLLKRCLHLILVFMLMMLSVVYAQDTPVFPITPGIIEGNINDSFPSIRYSFEVSNEDSVTITMENTSGDLDPFLQLFAPNGELITVNDDLESGNRNARISFTADSNGTFQIEATRFDQATGTTSGTFRLLLDIEGQMVDDTPIDPLSIPPDFGVDYDFIDYDEFGFGTIDVTTNKQYFVLGGDQGDFVRVILTITEGDLAPQLSVLNNQLAVISQTADAPTGEAIVYATLPERGWYLIEAQPSEGVGRFSVYPTRLAEAVISPDAPIEAEFTTDTPLLSYIFNGTIGDRVFAQIAMNELDTGVVPRIRLLDLDLTPLASRAGNAQARVSAELQRSAPYIIQVENENPSATGTFMLELRRVPLDITKENVIPVSYNETYKGTVSSEEPIVFYRFIGKQNELVTIEMQAQPTNSPIPLDPAVLLVDANLNELAFSDNVGSTRNGRIVQFSLPTDGTYYILAPRSGFANGNTTGDFDLTLTVGQISLSQGALTVTLSWQGDADLNLFVRDPLGRTVSWSNPIVPSGGALQIDSNTNCETPTDQPIEHITWQGGDAPNGDYVIWVWYQNVCSLNQDVTFSLNVSAFGESLFTVGDRLPIVLSPEQRFESVVRLTEMGGFVVNERNITNPSAQQSASQGGDILLRYGDSVVGNLNDDIFALFYQFQGFEGDTIRIDADRQTGNLDSIIVLRDADDRNLARNDDRSATDFNSTLEYTLPADGQYIIAVTRFGLQDGTTNGDFRLTLNRVIE